MVSVEVSLTSIFYVVLLSRFFFFNSELFFSLSGRQTKLKTLIAFNPYLGVEKMDLYLSNDICVKTNVTASSRI